MKHLARISSLSIIVFVISLFITVPVLAIPSLPSSFYGMVKVNNANVPDGTVIQGLVGGQIYAEGFTQTYQGNSVYALDVQGDDSDTAAQDGAREGDTIQFKIGGVMADQSAVWHGGTNANLDLTASSSGPIIKPQATPTPVPTQTAIVLIQPSLTPTAIIQVSAASVIPTQPSQAEIQSTQLSQIATQPSQPIPTLHEQAIQIPITSDNNPVDGSSNIVRVAIIIIVALLLVLILGYVILTFSKKM